MIHNKWNTDELEVDRKRAVVGDAWRNEDSLEWWLQTLDDGWLELEWNCLEESGDAEAEGRAVDWRRRQWRRWRSWRWRWWCKAIWAVRIAHGIDVLEKKKEKEKKKHMDK